MYTFQISGKRRFETTRRIIFVLMAAIALLVLSVSTVSAQSGAEGSMPLPEPQAPVPLDKLCVSGLVINHAEEPLSGWTITATYEGVNGVFASQTTVSDDDGDFRFDLPGPGRWALEVEDRDRWEGVTSTRLAVHVGYGSHDCTEVRFKVREIVEVIVFKIDDEHVPLEGWIITATPGPGNTFGVPQTQTTDSKGRAVFELTPGPWIFTEAPPEGAGIAWWRPISPATGVHRLEVVGPGPYTIRFKNIVDKKQNACINVTKYDVPPDESQEKFGLAGWWIQVLRANGSIAVEGPTDSFGEISFTGLPFGPYTVREIMQRGWAADSPTSYNVVLTSQDEGCAEIDFFNKQKPKGFCITGRKIDVVGGYGIPDWEIRATPMEPGGYEPDPVLTDGEGRYLICMPFEDYRIPGAVYEVSEVIPDGWTPVTPTSYKVMLPSHPDIPVVVPDFGNRQTRYTAGPPAKTKWNTCPPAHGSCQSIHVVRPGESVYKIAGKYNVSAHSIFRANSWISRQRHNWLYVNQEVCIP